MALGLGGSNLEGGDGNRKRRSACVEVAALWIDAVPSDLGDDVVADIKKEHAICSRRSEEEVSFVIKSKTSHGAEDSIESWDVDLEGFREC